VRGLAPEKSAKALYELAEAVAGDFASEATSKAVEDAPGVLAAGAALAVAGLNPWAIFIGALAGWATQKTVNMLWGLFKKVRGRESDIVKDVWNLIQEARKLYDRICPREKVEELERLETVVDEVAAKWGMSIGQFKAFLCNLGALTASRVVTEEVLEERLKRLEELALLKASAPAAVYVEAWEWPYVAEVGEGLAVLEGAVKGPYVETRLEEVLLRRLEAAVEEARRGVGRVILLRGAKGVGKSTAAATALHRLLKRGGVTVAVFDLGAAVDETRTAQFFSEARRRGLVPVLYLDPSRLEFYGSHTQARPPIAQAADNLAKLVELAKRSGAVALVVLSEDQVETMERSKVLKEEVKKILLSDVDAVKVSDIIRVEPFVKVLVDKYSGCSSDVVERMAKAVASSFKDGYAVVAVLAADWLKKGGCRSEEVERAVERAGGNVHRFMLDYIWHAVLYKDVAVARWAAPLILATGFYGPHPPKLGEAVTVAMSRFVEEIFGAGSVKRDDNVLNWLSQPLHGTLYKTIEKVAYGAVYRRFRAGNDELCQGSGEGPCHLVEICAEFLGRLPCEKCNTAADVEEEYAEQVARRFVGALIRDFQQVYKSVDELDVISASYGLAVLPVWDPRLKPLKGWFFIDGGKVGVVGQYLYPILRERGGELVKRAILIVDEAKKRGFYSDVDLLRAVGIAAAGQWDNATDEELEKAVILAANALGYFATALPVVLHNFNSLLSEAWRRVVSKRAHGKERRQRLADGLTGVVHNAAVGHPHSLLFIFTAGVDEPDLEVVAKRFDALYNAASNAGKLGLFDVLLYALNWYIGDVNLAATLLGKPQLGPRETFEEVVKRVKRFVSHLHGVEKAYVVAHLYPVLAERQTSLGELDKALKLAEETLKELEKLQRAYEIDKASTEEKLWPYLELTWIKPDLGKELNRLSRHVYYYIAFVYKDADDLDKAVEYAEKACKIAREFGYVYSEVGSCGLPPRLRAVRSGVPPVEEFERLWQRALLTPEGLGAEIIAATFGRYVVALASVGRLGEVKKALEEWEGALELDPDTSALTYGVLSLFDCRHLEKAVEGLPEGARANLPKFVDVLLDAIKTGLFTEVPEVVISALGTLALAYGEDMVAALAELVRWSDKLFLSALVGLA